MLYCQQKTWDIKVEENYLTNGWKKLTKFHVIKVDHTVVFTHLGLNKYTLQIFDDELVQVYPI